MEQNEKDHATDAELRTLRTPSRGRRGWEGQSPHVLLRVDVMGYAPGRTAGGSALAAVVVRISIPAALLAASRRLRRQLVGETAKVPAIIYVCSLIVSVILQMVKLASQALSAGAVLWILSGLGIVLLPSRLHNVMYAISIIIGAANALMAVTSISMEGVLVGEYLNGCAFVYGSLSFVDKISCGIALYVLESYQGSTHIRSNLGMVFGYSVTRLGLGLVPAACSLLSAIVAYTMELPDSRPKPLVEPLLA